jgi:hypothetical protein
MEMFHWMKEQDDFLNDELDNMPILTARGFKLDQNNTVRSIPDSLINTLKEEDYFVIDHW